MKKLNIVLAFFLVALLTVGAYFLIGANMKVEASAVANEGGVTCNLKLSNGSLFSFDYIELGVISPEGAQITSASGAGADVPALSSAEASFTISGENLAGAQVEIGYYVLGMRRTAIVTLS